ncbi:2-succinyl-5-enolpyruvyl-6-hydroxy-3-cyclohexene-1-carboxylic-acid synthase [Sporolactobacillus sp. CPB3-1]|uniref:2-succinyl-5-enolpyruvyl-6-hydroxy-3-cyclohexene-1-carboxylate synthase n=1 Tax=Sporolactobacillus mangiferae TaxID=2940498 RepID=A0ABT0MA47_9BACL|nr:2-succinyl-5-enolpyruvyl-6-hydroxy-3-cyclohexene-1-carboxylic-acid synthase [Sporolactobacillus mangiferae]MCL1631751.1 2-succinyl-5-enolpyruvyl-6-hydroxy-3-cyclohexene-1-carboxylic-acid synthase [Sporolactobacillus mangiferae]
MNHQELLTHYLSSLTHTLIKQNVRIAVISPGSRSTPIALLFEQHPALRTYIDIDERSAAFLALGLAKSMNEPVALLCTSGTAAANYYPAIVEAYFSRVPLLVITSDRPYELQHVSAPQTVDQNQLYGQHVKQFFQLEMSERDLSLVAYNQALVSRAVSIADGCPKGPVHLNVPLREPLLPCGISEQQIANESLFKGIHVLQGTLAPTQQQIQTIISKVNQSKRGVIICGPMNGKPLTLLAELANRAGFPLLADPLSQLRTGSHSMKSIIESYDTFLRNRQNLASFKADLIIRFGAPPVSKAIKLWMEQQTCDNLVIDSGGEWRDPVGKATEMIYCDEQYLCSALISKMNKSVNLDWISMWRSVNELTKTVLQTIRDEQTLSEEKAFLMLIDWLPEHAHLFVGNSMPIREVDSFLLRQKKSVHIYANRGANGIDGVVSTAVGVALAKQRVILAIGDLSFFHDMNGLLAAKQYQANLTIILINNDGGGIFSFLPQASEKKYFESLFGTPHGLDFAYAARLYDASYCRVDDSASFQSALIHSETKNGLNIIEVPTRRFDNVEKHRMLQSQLHLRLKEVLADDD